MILETGQVVRFYTKEGIKLGIVLPARQQPFALQLLNHFSALRRDKLSVTPFFSSSAR